jgi:hypothetical protein
MGRLGLIYRRGPGPSSSSALSSSSPSLLSGGGGGRGFIEEQELNPRTLTPPLLFGCSLGRMKVKVISRSTDEFTRERSQDLQVTVAVCLSISPRIRHEDPLFCCGIGCPASVLCHFNSCSSPLVCQKCVTKQGCILRHWALQYYFPTWHLHLTCRSQQKVFRNYDPGLRTQEKAVEYTRALNAAKLEKACLFSLLHSYFVRYLSLH